MNALVKAVAAAALLAAPAAASAQGHGGGGGHGGFGQAGGGHWGGGHWGGGHWGGGHWGGGHWGSGHWGSGHWGGHWGGGRWRYGGGYYPFIGGFGLGLALGGYAYDPFLWPGYYGYYGPAYYDYSYDEPAYDYAPPPGAAAAPGAPVACGQWQWLADQSRYQWVPGACAPAATPPPASSPAQG